jgi:hypothetical protein
VEVGVDKTPKAVVAVVAAYCKGQQRKLLALSVSQLVVEGL